jgi:glycosyltransferase involved in cell wall biosynthesis
MINPSVMILVKNEAYWLPYVLKQIEGYFDSYVLYDVGSTDKTRDIIDWFVARNDGDADLFVRKLPHVDPEVQGTFRNSMIAEGRRDVYFILDGDELYKPEDLAKIPLAATSLLHTNLDNPRKRYGIFNRVEVNVDLTKQYDKRRSHHRLYTRDAFWSGTHPGEVAGYRQSEKSEVWFEDITCWHMHNSLRSPKEEDATRRLSRKGKKAYHPGTLIDLKLLDELPTLRTRIEDFPVCPALEALWG